MTSTTDYFLNIYISCFIFEYSLILEFTLVFYWIKLYSIWYSFTIIILQISVMSWYHDTCQKTPYQQRIVNLCTHNSLYT
jgi:hypothetical protein